MSALTRTILVLFNGPPVCGIFQLSHGFQEGIGNAVCHVTARVTLCARNQFVHLLDAESHPSLVDVEVQNLFAGIAKAAEFETCGPPCGMIKARLMHPVLLYLSGKATKILRWNLLKNAVSKSQGQLVAQSRKSSLVSVVWSTPSI